MPDIEERPPFPPISASNEESCWGASGLPLVIGVTIAAPASAHTKGNWVQLVASTAKRVVAMTLSAHAVGTTQLRFLVDIGVGGAGSEVVVLPNIYVKIGASYTRDGQNFGPLLVDIPAGSRIAARCQCATASKDFALGVCLQEAE